MPERNDRESGESNRRQLQGLPVIRRNVAGVDLGSERHWVCAPTQDGSGREIASFGATTPELLRLAEWLKARQVESVAMESTGVYWIAPQEAAANYTHWCNRSTNFSRYTPLSSARRPSVCGGGILPLRAGGTCVFP